MTTAQKIDRLLETVERLTGAVMAPVPLAYRGDRAAARAAGFNGASKFSEWARRRGLKRGFKATKQARTVYLAEDLKRELRAEAQEQMQTP